ncbi:MAG: sugar phosphate isomerase/epimerase [Anaerolineae bacterium]|nr:sugar phosphate isomerase/epimerase [Anaerolineae bacterium]NUQ03009.1 sugar phosphate isomerase/epimerase [Anaerolineae bacterium]
MQIAIAESLLAAAYPVVSESLITVFERAAALGAEGVDISGGDLEVRFEDLAAAAVRTGVKIGGIHFGRQGALLSPDMDERERALERLRSNIACAVDLAAAGVVVVPHYGAYTMPDLTPWMSAGELHAEMLHMHLRTLSDFCHALGTRLFIQTASAVETRFVSRLAQAGAIVRRINHPDVLVGVDLGALADEGGSSEESLKALVGQVGYVALPVEALSRLDTDATLNALRASDYQGWITLTGAAGGDLPAAMESLRAALGTA